MRTSVLAFALLMFGSLAAPAQTPGPSGPAAVTQSHNPEASADTDARAIPTAYTLPPDKSKRATRLERGRTLVYFGSALWGILFLALALRWRLVASLRDLAAAATPRLWLQGLIFLPLLLTLVSLADLPFSIAGHHLSLAYGQSIQPWESWAWDWTKATLLTVAGGTLVLSLLVAIMRRSERRWWLWFWLLSIPLQVLLVFLGPYVVDPLFNHFEPLAQSNPALTDQLERVVARSNLAIPPSRMFLMRASEKYTGVNAYVTGFGASKRVVVWDTTIQKCPPDDVLFTFGHEQGHYVLNHVRDGIIGGFVGSLLGLYLAFHAVRWLLRLRGPAWEVTSTSDWAAVGVLLLVASVLGFVAEPIVNGVSRTIEHHADIYGQEVIHGLVADPRRTAAESFQRMGEIWLDDPNPSPFVVFWTYSHPPIGQRLAFAARYDPWRAGQHPRYLPAR